MTHEYAAAALMTHLGMAWARQQPQGGPGWLHRHARCVVHGLRQVLVVRWGAWWV